MSSAVQSREDSEFAFAEWLRPVMGFPLKVLPLVSLLGLLVAMASVPQFFLVISNRFGDSSSRFGSWLDTALVWLADVAVRVAAWFTSPVVTNNLEIMTQFALITALCLLPAAVIRSVRAASWMPVALTASGFLAGLIALPVTIWLVIAAWHLIRIGVWLIGVAQVVAAWLSSVLAWLAPVILVVGAIAIVGSAIVLFIKASGWYKAAAVGMLALVGVAWFTDIFDPVLRLLTTMIEWVGIAVIFVATILLCLFLLVAFLGAIVALFGTIGRVSVLSVTGAWEASRGAQKVTDLSAGIGLTVGVVVLAAALQRGPGEFGPWLETVWQSTPVVGYIPPPVGLMDLLVPSMAETFLVGYFAGFSVAIDIMLIVLVGLLGVLSLTLRSVPWVDHDGQKFRVAFPVLIAVGLALVFALPLIVMYAVAQGEGN